MRPVYRRLLPQTALLTFALAVFACSDSDNFTRPSLQASYTTPTGLVTNNPPQVFIGAGDISSCSNNGDEMTAEIIDTIPGSVYNLGDDAYDNGTTSEFANCYDPTWGRFKSRTHPSAGNHEYNTSGATPYYAYFGSAAGPSGLGYYSYDLGLWHIIVLNSNIARSVGSAQDTWLKNDLDAHSGQCTLAYWHHPLYSSTGGSGSGGASISSMKPFWDRLYAAHADLVLNGHRHFYERLAPMKPDGSSDPTNGITEIIAGSGGIGGGTLSNFFPTHITGNGDTRGVLKLYLYDDSFAWKFIPIAGKTYTDSGSTACHIAGSGGGGGSTGVSATNSTVTASPTSFTAGTGSSTITVTAKDGNGATISGASVTVTASGSGNTLTPATGTTDGSGVFTSTLTSSVAETKTISAAINGTAITQTASVTVNASSGGGGGGGNGTITQTLLTAAGNGANQSTFTTASIAPAANALVTVAIRMRRSSGPTTPTLSGGGLPSWTLVTSVDYGTIATPDSRLLLFRAMSASPGSGAITITFPSSVSNVEWSVSQWSGVDQSGTNGSGAVGQVGATASDGTTSLSKALAAFASPGNVALGVLGAKVSPPAVTPGSGFTEIEEVGSGETTLLESEWGVNLNTVSATLSKSVASALLAVELVAGGSSGPTVSASNSSVTASPSSITAGGSGSTVTVTAKDGSGNPISGATVVLAATGSGTTLTQPATTTDANGVATGTFAATIAGSDTVSATINGTAVTQRAAVTVSPGAASALAFTTQPSSTQANAPITPAVTVEVRDQFGNRVNSLASIAMAIGTNPASGTLAGTTPQAAIGGVATFSDLAIDKTGTGYTLVASSTGLGSATSNTFDITAAVPSASLSTVVAETPTFPAGGSSVITVTAKDGGGNPISGATVVLAATGSGNTLTQPATTTDVNGKATGTLASTVAESKTVSATISGTAITQQASVTVTAAAAAALAFTTQPGTTQANAPITPAVTVDIRDQYGNHVNSSASVGMAIGTNPGSGTLSGTTPEGTVNGVATFSDLAINNTGTGYTLVASSTGLTSATSTTFNVTAPAPSASLSTVVAATPTFAAGGSSAVTVTVKDGLGNPLSGVSVTLSSSVAGDVVTQPASATDVNGATAGSVSATSAGARTVTAVAGAVTLNQQPSLTVTAGTPDAGTSTVSANPTSVTAGSGSSAITVTVRDQYGNPVGGSTVVLASTGTNIALTQPGGATGSNGVASGSVSSTDAQTLTLSATAGGVAITQTASVTVTSQPPPGITQTLLTAGHDPTNTSTFTTASITPAPNVLVTVAVLTHQASAAAPDPVLTGGGMTTWEVVASVAYNGATPLDRLTIFRAMSAAPGSGPITIKSSVTVSNCQWIVSQWSGVDQSGTNGSGAIAQTASASGSAVTSLTAALGAFASGNDVAYGAFGAASSTSVISAGSGFTTIDQQPSGEGTIGDLFAEWALNLPAVTASWPSKNAGALGVEIKAAP